MKYESREKDIMKINICKSLYYLFVILTVALIFVLPVKPALAGCQLNIFIKNTGNASLEVNNEYSGGYHTSVKIKFGKWKDLRAGDWFFYEDGLELDPTGKMGDVFRGDFNCGAKRRYKFRYSCQGGDNRGRSFTDYYPSSTGWTKQQSVTVNLESCQ